MSKVLIEAFKSSGAMKFQYPPGSYLDISEFFYSTIQGEGVTTGKPAAFLRLQYCTLNCIWCDTAEVWRQGSRFFIKDLVKGLPAELVESLKNGASLVLTGGSPLRQQEGLVNFLKEFRESFGFLPFVEVENEAVLEPVEELVEMVSAWNNSPKLLNSGMKKNLRYKPELIRQLSSFENSTFKFVITSGNSQKDIQEIEEFFLPLVKPSQIILMPEGQTRDEIIENSPRVSELAIERGWLFSTRLHIILWNTKTGV